MKYCSDCGNPVDFRTPPGEHLPRHVCTHCGRIHYRNPKVVAGCIPEWEGRILLCRRGIEPRFGLWTLPAGFMENDESLEQAAIRETREETEAEVHIEGLFSLYSIPHVNQVYVFYRGHLAEPVFRPTPESTEVALFGLDEIPWESLAFRVVRETLRRYVEDRSTNQFRVHTGVIPHTPR